MDALKLNIWRTAAIVGAFLFLSLAVFAQSTQGSEAVYLNEKMCMQMSHACDESMAQPTVRSRACMLYKTMCAQWMVFVSSSSSSSVSSEPDPLSCGASEILCIQGTMPQCINGRWQCTVASSEGSVSSVFDACGPNPIRCMSGTTPQCTNGVWQCVTASSGASSEPDFNPNACIARCPDGYEYRACTEDGSPLYYFADPCMFHQGSSVSSASSASSVSSVQQQAGGCKVGGCSSHLCVEENDPGFSTCEWREEYACYQSATCERQASGNCGWTQTAELQSCLNG